MKVTGTILLITLLIYSFFGGCWLNNAYKLAHCDFKEPFKAEIMYGVGVVSPTFLVTTWLDLED